MVPIVHGHGDSLRCVVAKTGDGVGVARGGGASWRGHGGSSGSWGERLLMNILNLEPAVWHVMNRICKLNSSCPKGNERERETKNVLLVRANRYVGACVCWFIGSGISRIAKVLKFGN